MLYVVSLFWPNYVLTLILFRTHLLKRMRGPCLQKSNPGSGSRRTGSIAESAALISSCMLSLTNPRAVSRVPKELWSRLKRGQKVLFVHLTTHQYLNLRRIWPENHEGLRSPGSGSCRHAPIKADEG
jgi:hypothetical protein